MNAVDVAVIWIVSAAVLMVVQSLFVVDGELRASLLAGSILCAGAGMALVAADAYGLV